MIFARIIIAIYDQKSKTQNVLEILESRMLNISERTKEKKVNFHSKII